MATWSSYQLGKSLYIRNEAWSPGYLDGLERMRDYVILNLQDSSEVLKAHLRAVDFKNLEPDTATLNHTSELGREMIPNASLLEDDDPDGFPPNGNSITGSKGGSFKDHPISPRP